MITTDPKGVGNHISTKAVLDESRHDITEEYKYKEGKECSSS